MIFLDTTVLIDILAGEEKAVKLISRLSGESELYTSTVNIYEIMKGIYSRKGNRKKYLNALETLTANIYVLPLNYASSAESARIYGRLKEKGEFIDEPDYLIAGICLTNKVQKIVTRNAKHFRKVPGLEVIGY